MDKNNRIVEHVHLITHREIEIKFSKSSTELEGKENYRVYIDGEETENFEFLSLFNHISTLRLKESIDPEVNKVEVEIFNRRYKGDYVPYYSLSDTGTKSKIRVMGSSNVSQEVIEQAAEGINKVVGRSGFLSQMMAEKGCKICIAGHGESVYNIPEYRELYDKKDAETRVTIPGTIEKPIIVTTWADVMRKRDSYEYKMMWDLFSLFFEIGIKEGSKEAPLGPAYAPEAFKIYHRLEKAYEYAKRKGLWHDEMMKSLKEYYVRGAMIFFELAPESPDGSWGKGIGPVNTRLELREYDREFFRVLVEIHGEYEYISSYEDAEAMPWFVGTQPNRYGIDGKPLPKAQVTEVNLISPYQIEVKFNRQVFNAEDNAKYKVFFTPEGGEPQELTDFLVLPYAWDTVTLQFGGWQWVGEEYQCKPGPGFVRGKMGTDITGDVLSKGEYADSSQGRLNGHIKLKVMGDSIVDWDDNPIGIKEFDVAFKPYFGKIKRSDKVGVYIYADNDVKEETVEMASRFVDEMLSNRTYGQKIGDGITYNGGGLAIIAYGNHAYMQPHLRAGYSHSGLFVEGFGGGVAQTTEANVIRDRRTTRYKDEFILGHEFGHTIELTGIRCALTELYDEIGQIYEKVIGEGLWANSYAGSNRNEYFATLTNIWFSTMTESIDGTWNGTWGPINTRKELYRYDIDGYKLMKKIYYNGEETDDKKIINEKNFIGTQWESYLVSNTYDIDGKPYKDK